MKFLRNRSLSQLSLLSLLLMIIIFISQYFVIRYRIGALEESERKIDFVRGIQIGSQQIAFQSQLFLKGNNELAADIAAKIENVDHQLSILEKGGRIDGTTFFIGPLSRLPRITYDNLQSSWINYKVAIGQIIGGNGELFLKKAGTDSLNNIVPAPAVLVNSVNVLQESRWLSFSDWFSKLVLDLDEEVSQKQKSIFRWAAFFAVSDVFLIGALVFGFHQVVIRPIKRLESNIANHTAANFDNNEIGKIAQEVNGIIENLKDATDFVSSIGEGKLDIVYKESSDAQSGAGKNKLAASLIQMQDKLRALNESEKRRQWANEGLTKFVEIMRSSNDDLGSLGDAVISALVQYTNSNQGGLYILNDEDPNNKYLELISLFAFDIKKYQQQKIKLGEGLLGQTFLEQETTHLTNMPEEYIRITSGLGDANPRALLLFPLKVDKESYGIIELASFREYQPHEIEFVEKLGESIAATLASVRSAQKNRQLIEQFQQQTEEMRAQEEEMRQNMEEMQATQEEVARKEHAYIERIRELESKIKYSDSGESDATRERASQVEHKLRSKIEELTAELSKAQARTDEFAVAEELEKTLKMNLEAIKITQEELSRKAGL
jgi:hypothetical protein